MAVDPDSGSEAKALSSYFVAALDGYSSRRSVSMLTAERNSISREKKAQVLIQCLATSTYNLVQPCQRIGISRSIFYLIAFSAKLMDFFGPIRHIRVEIPNPRK